MTKVIPIHRTPQGTEIVVWLRNSIPESVSDAIKFNLSETFFESDVILKFGCSEEWKAHWPDTMRKDLVLEGHEIIKEILLHYHGKVCEIW